jgi:hypothetical protein
VNNPPKGVAGSEHPDNVPVIVKVIATASREQPSCKVETTQLLRATFHEKKRPMSSEDVTENRNRFKVRTNVNVQSNHLIGVPAVAESK